MPGPFAHGGGSLRDGNGAGRRLLCYFSGGAFWPGHEDHRGGRNATAEGEMAATG